MRIYDLHKNLEELVKDGKVQVELIGEDGNWMATISGREWNERLRRYVYSELGTCTTPSFLDAYDFIANTVTANAE